MLRRQLLQQRVAQAAGVVGELADVAAQSTGASVWTATDVKMRYATWNTSTASGHRRSTIKDGGKVVYPVCASSALSNCRQQ